ncbi:MAG: Frr, ribosome recycling factor [Candidatus Adlerbacteria bacterium]|nr:Frr, ribosome recycling factor [Candidatus Adlerbacteria bacterium]
MAYDFKPFEATITDITERLVREFSGVRTGRATPAIIDGIQVESYGSRVPINQVGNVAVEDARTLRITPWDTSMTKEIEKAISAANLGVSVGSDEKGVRVFFPELTAERRTQLVKLAKERMEEARTALRAARDDVWNDIQAGERDSTITEDEKFRFKEEMQKRVDTANGKFEEMLERKETEISGN